MKLIGAAQTDMYVFFRFSNSTEPFLEGFFMAFLAPRPVQNRRHWRLLVRRVNIKDSKMLLLHGNGLNMATQ
jgi:hypothetical protein